MVRQLFFEIDVEAKLGGGFLVALDMLAVLGDGFCPSDYGFFTVLEEGFVDILNLDALSFGKENELLWVSFEVEQAGVCEHLKGIQLGLLEDIGVQLV